MPEFNFTSPGAGPWKRSRTRCLSCQYQLGGLQVQHCPNHKPRVQLMKAETIYDTQFHIDSILYYETLGSIYYVRRCWDILYTPSHPTWATLRSGLEHEDYVTTGTKSYNHLHPVLEQNLIPRNKNWSTVELWSISTGSTWWSLYWQVHLPSSTLPFLNKPTCSIQPSVSMAQGP